MFSNLGAILAIITALLRIAERWQERIEANDRRTEIQRERDAKKAQVILSITERMNERVKGARDARAGVDPDKLLDDDGYRKQ
jgi:hypothetical protein